MVLLGLHKRSSCTQEQISFYGTQQNCDLFLSCSMALNANIFTTTENVRLSSTDAAPDCKLSSSFQIKPTKKLSSTSRRTSGHGCARLSPPPVLAVRVSARRGLIEQMSLRASCWVGIIRALVIWAASHQGSSLPGWNAIETRLVHSLPAVCV